MAFESSGPEKDSRAQQRKKDHIELAFRSATGRDEIDSRFIYEPLLGLHPEADHDLSVTFIDKRMRTPIWVSSMTGGTEWAGTINHRLAVACREYGLGMGLGSCRQLLRSDEHFDQFDLRETIGTDQLLFANLGIAQVQDLLDAGQADRIRGMVDRLRADGLIVHVNPLQEWLQPEGDRICRRPIDTLEDLLEAIEFPLIVKEVGQGFGPESLSALMQLPLAAIDFGAHGGTNFSRLEMLRADDPVRNAYEGIARIGHTALEMVDWVNELALRIGKSEVRCDHFIISGGVRDFLDGYYLTGRLVFPAIYGQASAFLRHAKESQDALNHYIGLQIRGLQLAGQYFRLRDGS